MQTKKQRLDYLRKIKNLKYSELIGDENIVTPENLRVTVARGNDKLDYYLHLIATKHNISEQWLINGIGDMDDNTNPKYEKINPTKEEVLNKLQQIKKKINRNREIKDDEVVEAVQYIVPIPGQAGLKKAFFAPDEYIEENFSKEIIHVKPSERAVYYKIEVDGDSMPGIVDQGDWARCENIPKAYWTEKGTFKPDKVYCLFHRYKGILFKKITKTFLETITLSSTNSDKEEFPDETFDLAEFSKILIVRVVEKRL